MRNLKNLIISKIENGCRRGAKVNGIDKKKMTRKEVESTWTGGKRRIE